MSGALLLVANGAMHLQMSQRSNYLRGAWQRGQLGCAMALALVLAPACGAAEAAASLRLPTPSAFVGLGRAVTMDGDTIVAGACPSSPVGQVLIWRESIPGEWSLVQTIQSPTPSQWFGCNVLLSGTQLLVYSAFAGPQASGAVYEYVRNVAGEFLLASVIVSPTPSNENQFGASMALDRDSLLVGAPRERLSPPPALIPGGVHLFLRIQGAWKAAESWRASNGASTTNLGATVHFYGDGFLAAEPWASNLRGQFVRFPARSGDGRATVTPPIVPSYLFSSAMTTSGRRIAVASQTTSTLAGQVHFFEEDSGGLRLIASVPDPEPGTDDISRFGAQIASLGSTFFVAAPRRLNFAAGESGIVYRLDVSPETKAVELTDRFSVPGGSQSLILFGESMAAQGDRLVVGAPGEQSGIGNVYVLSFPVFHDDFE